MTLRPAAWPALLLAGALAAAAVPARADPPLWRVQGEGGRQVVLFGSVHLLDAGESWFTPALARALAHADRLLFEIPLDAAAQAQAQQAALSRGTLPAGETLPALLAPADRARLAAVEAELKLPPGALDHMQPWLAETVITVLFIEHAGARSDLGVEQQIDHAAPPAAVRGALETVGDQIAALAGGTRADQVASLQLTLKDIHDDPGSFHRLVAAWLRGDDKALAREALDPLKHDSPGAYARLLTDRNAHWTGELEQLLRTGPAGETVVVVGVGHLVGRDGVPARLRRDGFAVEGP